MRWPWVSRELVEAWRRCAHQAETLLDENDAVLERMKAEAAAKDAVIEKLWQRVEKAEARNDTLVDRLLEVTGPGVLRVSEAAVEAARQSLAENKPGPGIVPRRRVTFDDIHGATQQAMADGTFDLSKRS